MAARYQVDKSELFEDVHSHASTKRPAASVAVKLAVGETQIVNEMRRFLVRNGVKLDSFGTTTEGTSSTTPPSERSKTVILVKNLPKASSERELRDMFVKCGVSEASIKRFVMPEYGLAALVEFGERQEARDAFRKLAYRKFKTLPIYLEWAPVDVFDGDAEERRRIEIEDEEEEDKKFLELSREAAAKVSFFSCFIMLEQLNFFKNMAK